jgi:GTP 3',8-cyclase
MVSSGKPGTVYWIGENLYLNITNKCSNKCWFCFRNFKQGVGDFNLKLTKEPSSVEIIAVLKQVFQIKRWHEAVFCGFGEPTSRLDVLLEIARWVKANHPELPIRLDTNGHGYVLNKGRDVPKELKAAGVTSVSVSLNGHDEQSYAENCRPSFCGAFDAVLDFVRTAKQEFAVEVSAVRMPEVDIEKVRGIVDGLGVPFRVRDYIPCFW